MNAAYKSLGPNNVGHMTEPLRSPTDLWKLPEPWTQQTRPPLLGKPTARVFHSYHRPPTSRANDRKICQLGGREPMSLRNVD